MKSIARFLVAAALCAASFAVMRWYHVPFLPGLAAVLLAEFAGIIGML